MSPARRLHLALVCVLLLGACAAGVNEHLDTANAQGVTAGFLRGLWHGAIVPITFIVSLFSREVRLYEIHNSGWPYDLGFVLGLTMSFGGGGARGGWSRGNKRTG